MRVALFLACVNDTLYPETGRAVMRLLARLGVEADFPVAQTCCGQAHCSTGYRHEAEPLARHFPDVFREYEAIVTPWVSCGAMVRNCTRGWVSGRERRATAGAGGRGAEDLRADGVPGGCARGDGRQCVLPAYADHHPAGGAVHWAADAVEVNLIAAELVKLTGESEVIKVKSMATEEIGRNDTGARRTPANRPAHRAAHPPLPPTLPGPGKAWSERRDLPTVPATPFCDW